MADPAGETVKEKDPVDATGNEKGTTVRLEDLEATIEAIVSKALDKAKLPAPAAGSGK